MFRNMSIANQRVFARRILVLVDTTLSSRIQMMSAGKTNPTSARARRRPRGCSTSFSHDNASHWQRRVTCRANLNVAATEIQFEVSFQEPNQSHASWAVVSSFISSVKLHSISTSSVKSHSTRFHFVCENCTRHVKPFSTQHYD